MPRGGPWVRNFRAGQNSVKVTTAPALMLRVSVTWVWQVPSIPRPPGPGMRHPIRVGPFGKNWNPLPQNDDCTRAMSISPAVDGTVPGMGGSAAWWLLAQADAASTRHRARSVALKTFIRVKGTALRAEVSLGPRQPRLGQCSDGERPADVAHAHEPSERDEHLGRKGRKAGTARRDPRPKWETEAVGSAGAAIGSRVLVIGMAGAGKSTFSRALSSRTGLPLIPLDVYYWKPGWTKPSESEWRDTQRDLLTGPAWIADGNDPESLDLRLERADTVVLLETPWWICASRALVRGLRKPVGEMPEGCPDSATRRIRDEWRLVGVIWRHRRSEVEHARATISQHGTHVQLYRIKSKREARDFLSALTQR